MTTLEYVKARKKLKCQKPNPAALQKEHYELGRIFRDRRDNRSKMDAEKPELLLPPSVMQDFIF